MKPKICIYTGSFDPFHLGHKKLVERAIRVFDKVFVVVADNPNKKYTFASHIRKNIAEETLRGLPFEQVQVSILPNGLLECDYAKELGVSTRIKGVRNIQDTEYERMLHEITVSQEQGIDTHVLFSNPEDQKISSSAIKELMAYNADVRGYVTLATKSALEIAKGQLILGVTGTIASGKSFVCSLVRGHKPFDRDFTLGLLGGSNTFHHIDVDQLVGDITYGYSTDAEVLSLRQQVEDILSVKLMVDGKPNRKEVGAAIFSNSRYNSLLRELYRPITTRMIRKNIVDKTGVILINAPLLIDMGMTYLCNNNVVIVKSPVEDIKTRLAAREVDHVELRYQAQLNFQGKLELLTKAISSDSYGSCLILNNDITTPLGSPCTASNQHKINYIVEQIGTFAETILYEHHYRSRKPDQLH